MVKATNPKSNDKSRIKRAKSSLAKALKSTPAIVIVGGLVAVTALWVIGSSNCGGSLNFRLSLSINEFQLKKEACP